MRSHTVVTYTSWGQRVQSSCCGVFVGVALFAGSFPLLTWNEGRSIERYESLEEGRKNVVAIANPADTIDSSLEGKLVYMSGKAEGGADATPYDPTFGVSPSNTLKLKRVAEMYQWEQNKSSHTTKTEGGGTRTETTYSYNKKWSDHVIDSTFYSEGHHNPSYMPYTSQTFTASPITVGSHYLSQGLVDKINWYSDWSSDGSLSVDNIADDYGKETAKVYGNGFYLGCCPGSPVIGDEKISFQYIPEGEVSFVAAQMGESFTSYSTKRGGSLLLLRSGYHTAGNLFLLAERDNIVVTWLVRFGGFLMMFLGLKMVSHPLEVVLDRIPCIGRFAGDLIGGASGIMTCIVAAALSTLTIAIAWLAYRPFFSIMLLGVVGGLVYMMKKRAAATELGDRQDSSNDATNISVPMVHARIVYSDASTSAKAAQKTCRGVTTGTGAGCPTTTSAVTTAWSRGCPPDPGAGHPTPVGGTAGDVDGTGSVPVINGDFV
mmetsp:Transcript_6172/g.13948  ORF Transcript_6172/g.13948 Transcript_6172/m.13948 type:complete len:489 (+) Transcript_6172:303-1769(+)